MSGAANPAVFLATGQMPSAARQTPRIELASLSPPRRQRARLWELSDSVHCSIIGTCLTTGELRRVMGKAVQTDVSRASDHDLHAQAVGLCSQHNASSKLLQKALDQRHETVIKRFARLLGEPAVM